MDSDSDDLGFFGVGEDTDSAAEEPDEPPPVVQAPPARVPDELPSVVQASPPAEQQSSARKAPGMFEKGHLVVLQGLTTHSDKNGRYVTERGCSDVLHAAILCCCAAPGGCGARPLSSLGAAAGSQDTVAGTAMRAVKKVAKRAVKRAVKKVLKRARVRPDATVVTHLCICSSGVVVEWDAACSRCSA